MEQDLKEATSLLRLCLRFLQSVKERDTHSCLESEVSKFLARMSVEEAPEEIEDWVHKMAANYPPGFEPPKSITLRADDGTEEDCDLELL